MPHRVTNASQQPAEPVQNFYNLGIAPKILDILERIKFKVPTPIQFKAIPPAIEGKDVVGIAQTGTGKTHAFAIPMTQRLLQIKGKGLILAPTRELAVQIEEAFKIILHPFGMKAACLIGGASIKEQIQALRRQPRVIIATPGRLIDHMEQKTVALNDVVMLVLDEADRMLDMGFAPQINQVLRFVPRERQTMLFSATIPSEIMTMASRYMKLPVSIEIAPSGTIAERLTQEVFVISKEMKLKLLEKILAQYHGSVLLFSRTKHNARRIARSIRDMGHRAAEIHSDRSLAQRREALEGFKLGRFRVLVATDIASRGIDVAGIELVINFDLPDDVQNYVHRIGRTGRAGHKGHAISFATPDQRGEIRGIEQLIRAPLPISQHPDVPAETLAPYGVTLGPRPFSQKDGKTKYFQSRRRGGSSFRRRYR